MCQDYVRGGPMPLFAFPNDVPMAASQGATPGAKRMPRKDDSGNDSLPTHPSDVARLHHSSERALEIADNRPAAYDREQVNGRDQKGQDAVIRSTYRTFTASLF